MKTIILILWFMNGNSVDVAINVGINETCEDVLYKTVKWKENPNYKYQFKHVLNIGTGDHNPIMNYTFDRVTDGSDNQSIILKLYDAFH